MRRQLILVFLAVSTLVATAFVVPLGIVVRRTAQDRAIDAARVDTTAVIPVMVGGGTRNQVDAAVSSTVSGADRRMTVVSSQGWTVGPVFDTSNSAQAALSSGVSSITELEDGIEVVAAVASERGQLSAIRVHVPNELLRQGQWRAWSVLAGVGAALVALSVLVADRLSRRIVQPARRLDEAARRLGAGDLDVKVEPDGPSELAELAVAFNALGGRVSSMLVHERELIAELSHRLRTPLTKLRMRADHVEDRELSALLAADIDGLTAEVNSLILQARGATGEQVGCDLNEVATERAEFWQVLAEDQLRPWSFRSWGYPLMVHVDERDLVAVIDVVIENVFSHTPEKVALSIACDGSADGFASFIVADGGPGFSRAQFGRGLSSSGSTGLGLDIAERVTRTAGGELQVGESELGGAEVKLVFALA